MSRIPVLISLALSLALASSGICNPLQKCNLKLEARVGIGRFWCVSPNKPVQSKLPQSQAHRVTGNETAGKIRPICVPRQVHQNSTTSHEKVRADSFIGELLALLLALRRGSVCNLRVGTADWTSGLRTFPLALSLAQFDPLHLSPLSSEKADEQRIPLGAPPRAAFDLNLTRCFCGHCSRPDQLNKKDQYGTNK